MKKLFKLLCLTLGFIVALVFLPVISTAEVKATTISSNAVAQRTNYFLKQYVDYGSVLKYNVDRVAGTVGEATASAYLKLVMDNISTNVSAVSNSTTTNGVQEFYYLSERTGKKTKSNNLIYTIAGTNSSKKIVLTCNYDNYFKPYLEKTSAQVNTNNEQYSEGVNASAASIAFMLALAETLPKDSLNFDVDLVMFGAGYDGNAGANYYLQTLGKAEREKTLLLVDISRIAFGSHVYYYSGEFGSIHDQFYASLGLRQYTSRISGASADADTPLGYENAGYSGATTLFAESGLNYLHLFAGTYEQGAFGGLCEYYGKSNATNTSKDNYDYVAEEELLSNFESLSGAIDKLVSSNLVEQLSQNDSGEAYKFFANSKLITWLTLVLLLVLLLISVIISYSVTKKTYSYATNNDVSAVMITLDEPDDEQDE